MASFSFFMAEKQEIVKELKPPKKLLNDFKGNEMEVALFKEVTSSSQFKGAFTFSDQIGIICKTMRSDTIRVSYQRIADVFGVSRQLVRKDHQKYIRGIGIDGRPSKLNQEELNQIENEIRMLHLMESYPSIDYISTFISTRFHKFLYTDTIRHIIRNNFKGKFKSLPGVPMEDNRLNVNINQIEENINSLRIKVKGIPLRFVMNLDEMGHSDYEDARKISLIVPYTYQKASVPYPVSRATKHSTCLACINPYGLFCKPLYIVQRSSMDSEIYDHLSPESFQMVHTESGFINSDAFFYWFTKVFLLQLRENRKAYNYYGPALLIMDGLLAHINIIQKVNLKEENLIIHILPAHSSEQTQPLDLGVFAVAKRFMSNYRYNPQLSRQTNQILRIHNSLIQSTAPMNCRASFRCIGIDSQIKFITLDSVQVIAVFNILLCSRIRNYTVQYIEQLIQWQMPLSQNQIYIYNHKNLQNKPKSSRITIPSFIPPKKKKIKLK